MSRHLHFDEIPSTMDMARKEAEKGDFLLVTAEKQTQGRGTKGRPWMSPKGNIYLTIALPRTVVPAEIGLLPLEAGLALWETTAGMLSPALRPRLRLKWPNDLMWEGRKAAGMLMEMAGDHLLVGVGVNIVQAPLVNDGGTPSACLAEAGLGPESSLPLASGFFEALRARLQGPRNPLMLEAWREKAEWTTFYRLRDRPDRPEAMPLELNAEGHLRVRFRDGREEWLVSEYLA